MKKPYLIYLNKTYNVWAMDAYKWMKENQYIEDDFKEIFSEVVFWHYLEDGLLENRPIFFVKDILTNHN